MTVQTYLPRAVAEALPIEGIAAEARGARVKELEDATLQYSNTRWRPAETLVTCQMPVAQYLLERLRSMARDADESLAEPAARAAKLWEDAIAHPYSPDSGPASGIRSEAS